MLSTHRTKPGLIAAFLLSVFTCLTAAAEVSPGGAIIPASPQLKAEGYLLIDATSGAVIVEQNSRERLPPASLTKIMTSYIAAVELKQGTLNMTDEVPVSVNAWRKEGSRMFIREGTVVSVEDLLRGIIIQSGNDASAAIAEHIAGSEEAFAGVMNHHAQQLGMLDTNFMNATGLPHPDHYTTAHDLALLTNALIKQHPDHYALYGEKYFTYNDIRQPNRNSLLWRDKTVDGVKTGHTDAAGFCLVASADRDGMRLISVVMGADSEEARAVESQKLLTYGFRYYETVPLYDALETLKTVRVWQGNIDAVDLGLKERAILTVPRGSRKHLTASMDIQRIIKAPLDNGQEVGSLLVTNAGEEIARYPLIALFEIPEAGFFSSVWDAIMLFIAELMGTDPLSVS